MNKKIKTKNYPNYTELKLDYSTANIFNPSFIKLFYNSLINLDNSCNLIIKGNGNFFSSGLDLFYTNELKQNELIEFIELFESLLMLILNREGKTLAYINGHTIAGGFILASSCDRAYCKNHKLKIGMNEQRLKIKLPPLSNAILRFTYQNNLSKVLNQKKFHTIKEFQKLNHFTYGEISFDSIKKDTNRLSNIKKYLEISKKQQMKLFVKSWFSVESIKSRNELLETIK